MLNNHQRLKKLRQISPFKGYDYSEAPSAKTEQYQFFYPKREKPSNHLVLQNYRKSVNFLKRPSKELRESIKIADQKRVNKSLMLMSDVHKNYRFHDERQERSSKKFLRSKVKKDSQTQNSVGNKDVNRSLHDAYVETDFLLEESKKRRAASQLPYLRKAENSQEIKFKIRDTSTPRNVRPQSISRPTSSKDKKIIIKSFKKDVRKTLIARKK